jgi:acetyl-CoA synthetase
VLPPLNESTAERLRPLLPEAATVANPLDYTAMIWGQRERLADIVRAVADDPAVDQLLLFYDEPDGIEGGMRASWDAARDGLADGAAEMGGGGIVASTLPELLQDRSAATLLERGVPAVAGLRTALACAAALRMPAADPARLRAIAAAAAGAARSRPAAAGAARSRPAAAGAARSRPAGTWLAEADVKRLLGAYGLPVPVGRVVGDEEAAVRAAREVGAPVAVKASSPLLRHKSEAGALALGVAGDDEVRAAFRRVRAAGGSDAAVLVEAMAPPATELVVAARRDAVVPALVVGLGGIWTELLDDVAIVPLPASAARVEAALRSLRGAGRLTGARGTPAADLGAVAALAAAAGELLLAEDLSLLELNPVLAGPAGAIAVDALARR